LQTSSFYGSTFVKPKTELLLTMSYLPLAIFAQMPTVIPLASEPHHHLALHNEYVNVYEVEVAPHDSVQLHRHECDAISIMMSNSEVIVRAPGKPDVRQTLSEGQVRLQSSGYVHSTSIEGDTPYRNVTVELLFRQQGGRNLCAKVIATQGLNCPGERASPSRSSHLEQPQFETDQTSMTLIRVLPHQNVAIGNTGRAELIVSLDDASVTTVGETGPGNTLRPGDLKWIAIGQAAYVFKNNGDKEARLMSFRLKPQGSVETTPAPRK
jgi:quercetin dioxygenase-like cupin family protein